MLAIDVQNKSHYYLGSCPFGIHEDKNPSFVIYKNTGHYVCFSCGEQGSIKNLIFNITGKPYYKFLNIEDITSYYFENSFKKKTKIRTLDNIRKQKIEIKGQIKDINENEKVLQYCYSRFINRDFIDFYNLGYCDYLDINTTKFQNRIIIPIYEQGKLINIEGRDFTKKQNKKVLYPKGGTTNTLFNYDFLDYEKELIVVEGIMDLPKLFNLGFRNITCTFGIQITNKQKEMLKLFKNITLFPDGDEAGLRMINQFDNFMDYEFNVMFINDVDPGDAEYDDIKFAYNNKKQCVEFLIDNSGLFVYNNVEGG